MIIIIVIIVIIIISEEEEEEEKEQEQEQEEEEEELGSLKQLVGSMARVWLRLCMCVCFRACVSSSAGWIQLPHPCRSARPSTGGDLLVGFSLVVR